MKLPNGDRHLVISMQKILGYCLNLNHDKGKEIRREYFNLGWVYSSKCRSLG
ncbi:hypothetical protein [Pseudanabaena sp. ABRG5-3]|uniref:hypothetical protein n=1 Tax=Pseudanabaena sp. ABRG5-3 TaxID=685565 RepID=UPI0018D5A0F6|nr:hypothetical protein [Pseudanabaena sp. ABRG5-3]